VSDNKDIMSVDYCRQVKDCCPDYSVPILRIVPFQRRPTSRIPYPRDSVVDVVSNIDPLDSLTGWAQLVNDSLDVLVDLSEEIVHVYFNALFRMRKVD
jgi:hypothetical protein